MMKKGGREVDSVTQHIKRYLTDLRKKAPRSDPPRPPFCMTLWPRLLYFSICLQFACYIGGVVSKARHPVRELYPLSNTEVAV